MDGPSVTGYRHLAMHTVLPPLPLSLPSLSPSLLPLSLLPSLSPSLLPLSLLPLLSSLPAPLLVSFL